MRNQKQVIETLLIANPFPLTFSEKELNKRIELVTESYKVKISFTSEDNTAHSYKLNYNCTFTMLETLKAAYKAGQTHATTGHFQSQQSHGHVVMIKSKKQQQEDLRNLTETTTAAYKTEVEQSQRSHLKSLTDSAQEQAEVRILAKRQAEQDAASEALIQSYMEDK